MITIYNRRKIYLSRRFFLRLSLLITFCLVCCSKKSLPKSGPVSAKEIVEVLYKIDHPTLAERKAESYEKRVKRYLKQLIRISESSEEIVSDCLRYYIASCYYDLESKRKCMKVIREALKKDPDHLDFLYLLKHSKRGKKEKHKIQLKIAKILPLSSARRDCDERMSLASFFANLPRGGRIPGVTCIRLPEVPKSCYTVFIKGYPLVSHLVPGMIAIGDEYKSMGFYREAINAYIEASGTRTSLRGRWLKVAELERTLGERELAIRAYLKQAFFVDYLDEKTKQAVIMGLEYCLKNKRLKAGKLPVPKLEVDKVRRIANLYAKMNVHPMGLSLLRKTERALGVNLSKERKQILAGWQKILGRFSDYYRIYGLTSFYVLGYNTSQVKDWSKIKIARPHETFWKPKSLKTSLEWYLAELKKKKQKVKNK